MTTIDGDAIAEATIDGEDVSEITVDGDVVWTATTTVNISQEENGNHNQWDGHSQYYTSSNTSVDGSYSIGYGNDSSDCQLSRSIPTEQYDEFDFYIRPGDGPNNEITFYDSDGDYMGCVFFKGGSWVDNGIHWSEPDHESSNNTRASGSTILSGSDTSITWYHIKLLPDYSNNELEIILDDSSQGTYSFYNSVSDVSSVELSSDSGSGNNDGYIDKIEGTD